MLISKCLHLFVLAVSSWLCRPNVMLKVSSGSCITITMEFSLGAGEVFISYIVLISLTCRLFSEFVVLPHCIV